MLIGLTGKLGSGKDTACARLFKICSQRAIGPCVRLAFADKLKKSAAATLGVSVEYLEKYKNDPDKQIQVGWVYDELGLVNDVEPLTIRKFLQLYGTEAHRDVFGSDFWVNATLPKDLIHHGMLYVVTDVRFPNEVDRVHKLGGTIVRVNGVNGHDSQHASEQVPEKFDSEIDNTILDDSFAHLDSQLEKLLDSGGHDRI